MADVATGSNSIYKELCALCANGYNESVNKLTTDIIDMFKEGLKCGIKEMRYCKTWEEAGYFMSPMFTRYYRSEKEITKFKKDISNQLVNRYGIYVLSLSIEPINKDIGVRMKIEIELALKPISVAEYNERTEL